MGHVPTTEKNLQGLRWVRLSKYCELSGETHDGVVKRVRTGHWLKGVLHAGAPDKPAQAIAQYLQVRPHQVRGVQG